MDYVLDPPPQAAVPVAGGGRFPVRRIYCVGRNYVEHAIEMGGTGREPPFFFLKPADAVLPVAEGTTGEMRYPSLTKSLHHEVELVVAIGRGGRDIAAEQAMDHVWGYAVGLDMTRRDLQNEMKKQGRPWSIGKGFDQAAPIGALKPADACRIEADTAITLNVNGQPRQRSQIGKLIWSIPGVIPPFGGMGAGAGRPDLYRYARGRGRGGSGRPARGRGGRAAAAEAAHRRALKRRRAGQASDLGRKDLGHPQRHARLDENGIAAPGPALRPGGAGRLPPAPVDMAEPVFLGACAQGDQRPAADQRRIEQQLRQWPIAERSQAAPRAGQRASRGEAARKNQRPPIDPQHHLAHHAAGVGGNAEAARLARQQRRHPLAEALDLEGLAQRLHMRAQRAFAPQPAPE